MRKTRKGLMGFLCLLVCMSCTPSMNVEEMRSFLVNAPEMNKTLKMAGIETSIRFLPKALAEAQGLQSPGTYFELRTEHLSDLYYFSEQSFVLQSKAEEYPSSLYFIENYGSSTNSSRAIICFLGAIEFGDQVELKYQEIGVSSNSSSQAATFSGDQIIAANRINLAL